MPSPSPSHGLARRHLLAAAATLPLLAPGPGRAAAPLRKVRLWLKWLHQFQFAGFYVAKEQGLYEAAGLDVEILEGGPEIDPAGSVLAGEAEFGVGNSSLLLDRAAGAAVTVLGVVFQHSPFVLLARRDTGIDSVHDLVGKTLMLEAHAAELLAYLALERVPSDRLTVLPHAADVTVLARPGVDAISAYTTSEPYDLQKAGIPYTVLNPRASGIDFYGDALFTTEPFAERERALVTAFRDASMAGWRQAVADPGAAIELILRRYAPDMDRGRLTFEAEEIRRLMLADMVDAGYMHEGRWRHIADGFAAAGLMPKDFPLDGFLFDPGPARAPAWLAWVAVGSTVAALGAGAVTARLQKLNRSLSHEVTLRRTAEAAARQARERAEEKALARARFMAGMTHEFRTPLTAIMGLADLLQDIERLPAEEANQYAAIIRSGSQHLLRLIEDLLDLSKIEAGKMELRPERIDVARSVTTAVALMRPQTLLRKVALETEIAPDAGIAIADERAVTQILLNLLSNAIKFTLAGGNITVRAGRSTDNALLFTVSDTGVGIAPDDLQRLFLPFERADNAYAAARTGTGLGLALVKLLAELHGGSILADSTPGRGTSVTIRLPQPA